MDVEMLLSIHNFIVSMGFLGLTISFATLGMKIDRLIQVIEDKNKCKGDCIVCEK